MFIRFGGEADAVLTDVRQTRLPHSFSKRTPQSRREQSIHTIKYMGSKRQILDFVAPVIEENVDPGDRVLDLMAGTASVGYSIRERHPVIANDIQQFSAVAARALLCTTQQVPPATELVRLLDPWIKLNREALQVRVRPWLQDEHRFIQRSHQGTFTQEDLSLYKALLAAFPNPTLYTNKETVDADSFTAELQRMIVERRECQKARLFPYILTTAYFANTYVGLAQAVEIDSYRYAIDQAFPEGSDFRDVLLTALLFATSYVNAGTGHFAQYRDIETPKVLDDVFVYRARNFRAYFLAKLEEFHKRLSPVSFDNDVWELDYRDAIATANLSGVRLVYADPPYSFVHYSRFYHLLETLVRYDYPVCEWKGRYRRDRHQSPFCIRTKVESAFRELIEPLADSRVRLIISYSNAPSSMIHLEEIMSLCREAYRFPFRVSVVERDYVHTTMGRRGDNHREVREALVVCSDF